MTFSIELLPAPLGPMMARTSCSRTSNVMSDSALTPPNASEMCSSSRMTSPMRRAGVVIEGRVPWRDASCGPGLRSRQHLRIFDAQIGGDESRATILELDQRLDVLDVASGVQRVDQHRVFLGDEAPAHLARARQLVVVRVEFLVQDQEPLHLGIGETRLGGELGIDLLDAAADQLVH